MRKRKQKRQAEAATAKADSLAASSLWLRLQRDCCYCLHCCHQQKKTSLQHCWRRARRRWKQRDCQACWRQQTTWTNSACLIAAEQAQRLQQSPQQSPQQSQHQAQVQAQAQEAEKGLEAHAHADAASGEA